MIDTLRPTGPMDCTTAQALLPDYLEGELAGTQQQTFESHLAACEVCEGLVAELRGIVRMAATLPVRQPSRDLWDGIATRIEAPVVPLVTGEHRLPRAAKAEPRQTVRSFPVRQRWLAAAAALLLVAGSAAVTRQLMLPVDATAVATNPMGPRATVEPQTMAAASVEETATGAAAGIDQPEPAPSPAATRRIPGEARLASAGAAGREAAAAPPSVYDRELSELRGLLDGQRESLDSATVRVLEQNLRIIDGAIRESREALMSDPASGLLNQRLNESLSEKLELMRTAVLLSGD